MEFEDAIEKAVEEAPERNFTETIELILNFREVDLSNPDERIDKEIILPQGRGKKVRIGVIASGETINKAREIADKVFTEDDLEELGEDKTKAKKIAEEFNHFVAEAKLMPKVGQHLGQVLGPRNNMPKPLKPGEELEDMVNKLKGTIKIKAKGDFTPTLQTPIGTEKMDLEDLEDNASTVYEEIKNELPKRTQNIKSVYVKTSMGPSIEVKG